MYPTRTATLAFVNIKKAAQRYGIDVEESSWHELGKRPHTKYSVPKPKLG